MIEMDGHFSLTGWIDDKVDQVVNWATANPDDAAMMALETVTGLLAETTMSPAASAASTAATAGSNAHTIATEGPIAGGIQVGIKTAIGVAVSAVGAIPATRPAAIGARPVASAAARTAAGTIARAVTGSADDLSGVLKVPGALRYVAKEVHGLAHPIKFKNQTIAIAEVSKDGGSEFWASANGGAGMASVQKEVLGLLGAQVKNGRWHAEVNIISQALASNSAVRGIQRWGISWGKNQKYTNCPQCAPFVTGPFEVGRVR
ncbi:hypothetical protein [Promicromonospora soli]